jgi:hypothetical protein
MVRINHPTAPPPAPPRQAPAAPPAPAILQKPASALPRQQSTFEVPNRREARLRQWSEQSGGTSSLRLPEPVSGGGESGAMDPLFLGGNAGGVERTHVVRGLAGADAYAELETRVQAAQDAQLRVDNLEVQLADDLAILGPTLTPEERDSYIQNFRAEHTDAYAQRDAAVAAVADHLEAEGANLEGYLAAYHEQSQYTTGAAALPLMDGLKLVANSAQAATAVDFLNEHGRLLGMVAPGAGHDFERDIYAPALTATMTSALASGQTAGEAVASVRTLISRMPDSVRQHVLGSNPDAALDALSRVASGDVSAITDLSRMAAGLGTPGAGALVSAALSMAMLEQPERFQSPTFLSGLIAPLGSTGMAASALGMALKGVGEVVTRTSLAGAAGNAAAISGLAQNLSRLGSTLGAMTSALNVLQLLSQQNPNNGTWLQVGAQSVGGAFAAASALGLISGPVGGVVAAGAFIATQLGKFWEARIHREEVRQDTIARATRLGISDAEARVSLGMDHPTQARDLALLGVDYRRMGELVSRGLMETGSVVTLARDFEMGPEDINRLLDVLAPPGATTPADPGFFYFMQFYQQARTANPGGTAEQLVTWMQDHRPPPTHGGVGYVTTDTMLRLLASMV